MARLSNLISFENTTQRIFKRNQESSFSPLTLSEVDVAVFAEGTYPFLKGGVSSVIHQIIEEHPDLTFGIIHIAWDRSHKKEIQYPKLSHLKWVHTVYLSETKKKKSQTRLANILNQKQREDQAEKVFNQLKDFYNGTLFSFESFYHDYLNPLTRRYDIREVLESDEFVNYVVDFCKKGHIPLVDVYWLHRDMTQICLSMLEQVFPRAKVYHSHTAGYAGLAAALASIQHGRKFVLTEHSLYIRDVINQIEEMYSMRELDSKNVPHLKINSTLIKKKMWTQWFRIIGEITYRRADVSTYLYQKIAEEAKNFGLEMRRSRIIPNGLRLERFEQARNKQIERDGSRFINSDHVWTLGFIGRVVPVKGVLDFISAISTLVKIWNKPFVVEVIGPTDEDPIYFSQCVDKVRNLGLENRIKFLGPQNVAKFLEGIDLCILSSHSEALPVVILESMASGVPVVSTDVGSVRQIMCDRLTTNDDSILSAGAAVPALRPKLLAQAIKDILESPEFYKQCREEGPKRVDHSFQLNHVMKKYSELYEVNEI